MGCRSYILLVSHRSSSVLHVLVMSRTPMAKIVSSLVVKCFFCAGAILGALQSFLWKILVPLMKLVHAHDCEILNEVKWQKSHYYFLCCV